jgi:LmbE family N-acetylglucosaminyl deacetylase
MAGQAIETISVHCEETGFVLPEKAVGAASALLEFEIRASVAGAVSDPAIEIIVGDFREIQYFERGAQGTRFLNVSQVIKCRDAGEQVRLNGHRASWRMESARLHVCREKISEDEQVLVIASHPDDAEIAAFGLCADTRSTVVTLTAGDASDRYKSAVQPWLTLSRGAIAKMRVLDSLTIPQFGSVPPEQAINLCMPDGRLSEMYLHPDRDFRGEGADVLDFPALRGMNRSTLIHDNTACTWKSLVCDLGRIVTDIKPSIVVTPHPVLDHHPDHLFTTVALSEALRSASITAGRMFFYTVHNRRSEMWPFGPAGSGVALLPIMPEDGICASGFYSHRLSGERLRQKFVALEAMHDVRDMQWPPGRPYPQAVHRIAAELRAMAHGMGVDPTSYLRRAVRPDELFFVTSFADGTELARQAVKQRASSYAP